MKPYSVIFLAVCFLIVAKLFDYFEQVHCANGGVFSYKGNTYQCVVLTTINDE